MSTKNNRVKQKATIDKDPKREVSKDGTLKDPKLVAIKCCLPTKKKKEEILELEEITKTANKVKTYLTIETEGADNSNFYANITLECNAWKEKKQTYSLNVKKTNQTKLHEQDIYLFIPDENDWADPKIKTAKLKIKVILTSIGLKSKFSNNHSLNPDFYPIITYNSLEVEIDLDYCGHGMEYRENIIRKKFKSLYGPYYDGSNKTTLKSYQSWGNDVTDSEKRILIAMSENEGAFEDVHSYDDQFMSLGIMQKTISPDGEGQLSKQLCDVVSNKPEIWSKYKCCFEYHRLSFEKNADTYQTKYKEKVVDAGAKLEICKNYQLDSRSDRSVEECVLEPFIKLAHDSGFKDKQVADFIDYMNDALNVKIYNKEIKQYVKSDLGKATVLDHRVNRYSCVKSVFTKALDNFLEEENKEKEEENKISSDPSTWGKNHAEYEAKILDIYGPLRGKMCSPMTDATIRYNSLKLKLK